MVTDLEPDILECKVKWALGNITKNNASGGDEIPAELLKLLKDGADKILNISANLEDSAVATGLEKVSFHSNPKERVLKNVQNTVHLCSFCNVVRLCSKAFKLGFGNTWTENFFNSMKLQAMPCRATQDGWVMVESSAKTWSIGEGNGNHFNILAWRTPWAVWKGKKIGHWKMNSPGQ